MATRCGYPLWLPVVATRYGYPLWLPVMATRIFHDTDFTGFYRLSSIITGGIMDDITGNHKGDITGNHKGLPLRMQK
jgi:hypothetical protein